MVVVEFTVGSGTGKRILGKSQYSLTAAGSGWLEDKRGQDRTNRGKEGVEKARVRKLLVRIDGGS